MDSVEISQFDSPTNQSDTEDASPSVLPPPAAPRGLWVPSSPARPPPAPDEPWAVRTHLLSAWAPAPRHLEDCIPKGATGLREPVLQETLWAPGFASHGDLIGSEIPVTAPLGLRCSHRAGCLEGLVTARHTPAPTSAPKTHQRTFLQI